MTWGKECVIFSYEVRNTDINIFPVNYYSLYGSRSEQLRWYEISIKIRFLTEFMHQMQNSDTYDIREIEENIKILKSQKWLIFIEKICSFLRISSSLYDNQEVFVTRLITEEERRKISIMLN